MPFAVCRVPFAHYRKVLQVSSAHVYLTYPFVLSWSCLEAMATGCNLVAGDVAPVREVLSHGRNGLLVPPLHLAALQQQLNQALTDPTEPQARGQHAKAGVHQAFSRQQGAAALAAICAGAALPIHRSTAPTRSERHAA